MPSYNNLMELSVLTCTYTGTNTVNEEGVFE